MHQELRLSANIHARKSGRLKFPLSKPTGENKMLWLIREKETSKRKNRIPKPKTNFSTTSKKVPIQDVGYHKFTIFVKWVGKKNWGVGSGRRNKKGRCRK
jgi:hypothetical protein